MSNARHSKKNGLPLIIRHGPNHETHSATYRNKVHFHKVIFHKLIFHKVMFLVDIT